MKLELDLYRMIWINVFLFPAALYLSYHLLTPKPIALYIFLGATMSFVSSAQGASPYRWWLVRFNAGIACSAAYFAFWEGRLFQEDSKTLLQIFPMPDTIILAAVVWLVFEIGKAICKRWFPGTFKPEVIDRTDL